MKVTAKKIIQGQLDFSVHDNTRIEQALNQIQLIHRNEGGLVFVAIKPGGFSENWSQYHLHPSELTDKVPRFLEVENVYISQSSFKFPKRTVLSLHRLNTLFVDLDYHHVRDLAGLSKEQIVWMLEEEFFKYIIPTPNLILSTGEGLALIWVLEPESIQSLPLWQTVENYLINKLIICGADPVACDAARVIRVAGTKNSDNGAFASIIRTYDLSHRYVLKEIQQEYLPSLTTRKERELKMPRKSLNMVFQLFTIRNLHYKRIGDLITLQAARTISGDSCVHYREKMCFLFRYWMCCYYGDPEDSLKDTRQFNKRFIEPLTENEVIKATASAEKGWQEWLQNFDSDGNLVVKADGNYKFTGYNYTNWKLIKMLNITSEEQRKMDTIISKKEKYRRNNERRTPRFNGMTPKQKQIKERLAIIEQMINNGKRPTEIVKALSTKWAVSESTVWKHIAKLDTVKKCSLN